MGSDEVVYGSRAGPRAVVKPGEHLTDVARHDDCVQLLVDQQGERERELALVSRLFRKELVDDLGRYGVWLIELAPREGALDEFLVSVDE